eukprot:14010020-Alexandrium_andersonii.AAC.1
MSGSALPISMTPITSSSGPAPSAEPSANGGEALGRPGGDAGALGSTAAAADGSKAPPASGW